MQGFALGMATIVPIGPQNVLVMNQGIQRQYPLLIATLCLLSDMVLIAVGMFGGGALLSASPVLLRVITVGGVAFLTMYGFSALRLAWRGGMLNTKVDAGDKCAKSQSRWRVVITMLAVTWLNPHVYLDTLVVLGSIGGQLEWVSRRWFAVGAMLASLVWFYGLAILSARLAPWLNQERIQRGIQLFVGVVMWLVAAQLARQAWDLFIPGV
ncbi:LysE family transporter [Acerihabitans sp. TG2]|uniref:LysE family transporter n=1 Tax=Acerihabitans sp. TG2 TaxID=3096008 RepID=UPI003A599B2D